MLLDAENRHSRGTFSGTLRSLGSARNTFNGSHSIESAEPSMLRKKSTLSMLVSQSTLASPLAPSRSRSNLSSSGYFEEVDVENDAFTG